MEKCAAVGISLLWLICWNLPKENISVEQVAFEFVFPQHTFFAHNDINHDLSSGITTLNI